MELIDIGCNLAHDSFDSDREEVLQRARAAGVVQLVVTGASEAGSIASLALAREHPGELFATAGVHPRAGLLPRSVAAGGTARRIRAAIADRHRQRAAAVSAPA
jgi:Tat protein secretion system quality control protein TatD with DNase activity